MRQIAGEDHRSASALIAVDVGDAVCEPPVRVQPDDRLAFGHHVEVRENDELVMCVRVDVSRVTLLRCSQASRRYFRRVGPMAETGPPPHHCNRSTVACAKRRAVSNRRRTYRHARLGEEMGIVAMPERGRRGASARIACRLQVCPALSRTRASWNCVRAPPF